MKKFLKKLLCRLFGHRSKVHENLQGYKYVSRPTGEHGPFGMGSIQWYEATQCTRCGTYGIGRRLDKMAVGEPVVYAPYIPLFVTKPVKELP